jgi:NADH-quinone oxidoreductase subunit K
MGSFLLLNDFISISVILFVIGLWGMFVMRHNIIIILMTIEMILLSVTVLFVSFSVYLDDIVGFIMSLFILTVAAAESSIGLAILVSYYRLRGGIGVDIISLIKS